MEFEQPEALLARAQAVAAKGAIDRARSHPDAPHPELVRDPLWTPGGLRQRLGQDPPLDHRIQLRRPPRPALAALGMQTVRAVPAETVSKLVVGRPGDPGLPAGRRDVAEFLGSAEET